jgi:hypothetical protein
MVEIEMTSRALRHVLKQVQDAKPELSSASPKNINWNARAIETCNRLVPWLENHSTSLASYLTSVMNSPNDVRESVKLLMDRFLCETALRQSTSDDELLARVRSALEYENLLISGAGGTVVSKLIERFLIDKSENWNLESNSASDYPDLFFRDNDYSMLPKFKRGSKQVYGAALKGKSLRPVRVPDGLEVKTCKGPFAVDCHHAHAGLHLVVLFRKARSQFRVNDIQVAFMRQDFYRITVPASPTTTLKASFNGQNFVSILSST